MIEESESPGHEPRLVHGVDSLGAITAEAIEQRATELAKIEGRTEPNALDLEAARQDLLTIGQRVAAPETTEAGTEELTYWDSAPASSGTHAERVLPEDETSIAQTLIEEGLEEADHEQRVASAEENPPAED